MENIISGILEAESSAVQMVEKARASALLMVDRAKAEAVRLQEDQEKAWGKECALLILHAQATALNSKYAAVDDAVGDAQAMVDEKSIFIGGVAEKFFGKILGC